jgi:ubiquinone/menaquinone biosynthesis C-methylase UbiE
MFRPKDRQKCQELFERYYRGSRFRDSYYREAIRENLRPGYYLLDAGCGRYLNFCKEFSSIAQTFGIDLDSTLDTQNRCQPFGMRGDLSYLPFPSNHFDMVICRSVVEHLADPVKVFAEFERVLRPSGIVVIVTPNKYDYVSVIASLTPHWLHQWLVSRIFQVPEHDVFPTLYRANTVPSLRRLLTGTGLVEQDLRLITHYPAYLMFSPVLFRFGMMYERLTSLKIFRGLRATILCVFQKPPAQDAKGAAVLAGSFDVRSNGVAAGDFVSGV